MSSWQAVIGIEVHARLKTRSKLFSGSSAAYGATPNTHASAIDVALPGTLPVLNQRAIDLAIRFGLAVNAKIAERTVFVRKSYFYPDLSKGYQISQFELPIVGAGQLEIDLPDGAHKTIRINRAHLEEDAGKSVHTQFSNMSGIDFNRAGTPLLEIVSEPDLHSVAEAVAYARTLHRLIQYLDICDGNMQEGSYRCDINISVRRSPQDALGTRTELKNLNSFRFMEQAMTYEIERQIELIESGGEVVQETRLFDPQSGVTQVMRSKEESHDYQYFPDPDLLPIVISQQRIAEVQASMPELPAHKAQRFHEQWGLKADDIQRLLSEPAIAGYFEACAQATRAPAQLVANWVNTTWLGALRRASLTPEESPVSAHQLAELLDFVAEQTLSTASARDVFGRMWQGEGDARTIIEREGLTQSGEADELRGFVEELIAQSPKQLAQYHAGKDKVLGFFVGRTMQHAQGKVAPAKVNALVKSLLDASKSETD